MAALYVSAQQNDVPLERSIYTDIDRAANKKGSSMYTGLRPMIESRVRTDQVAMYRVDTGKYYYRLTEKIFREHLIQVREGDVRITIDPAFHFEVGSDLHEEPIPGENRKIPFVNTRGFRVAGDLGRTVSFQTTLYESQGRMPGYLHRYALEQGAMPGQGRVKASDHRSLDHAWAAGNVSWSPASWINVQLGNGRQFVGNGYRSVLLSDNVSPYPYYKISTVLAGGRLHYTVLRGKFTMIGEKNRLPIGRSGESLFYWKRTSMHHLGLKLGGLQLGFFEATIWDNVGPDGVRPYDPLELNPLIGVNTAVRGFRGAEKIVVGLDLRMRLTDKAFVYGQYALDDDASGRAAWQAGMQWFLLEGKRTLNLLLEYNAADPYTYAAADARMNYAHSGMPLAHVLGAAFSEALGIVEYLPTERWRLRGQFSWAEFRRDTRADASAGGDVFRSTDLPTSEGLSQRRTWIDLSAAYRFNPRMNFQFAMGYRMRDLTPGEFYGNSGYLYVSLGTALFNRYYDI